MTRTASKPLFVVGVLVGAVLVVAAGWGLRGQLITFAFARDGLKNLNANMEAMTATVSARTEFLEELLASALPELGPEDFHHQNTYRKGLLVASCQARLPSAPGPDGVETAVDDFRRVLRDRVDRLEASISNPPPVAEGEVPPFVLGGGSGHFDYRHDGWTGQLVLQWPAGEPLLLATFIEYAD